MLNKDDILICNHCSRSTWLTVNNLYIANTDQYLIGDLNEKVIDINTITEAIYRCFVTDFSKLQVGDVIISKNDEHSRFIIKSIAGHIKIEGLNTKTNILIPKEFLITQFEYRGAVATPGNNKTCSDCRAYNSCDIVSSRICPFWTKKDKFKTDNSTSYHELLRLLNRFQRNNGFSGSEIKYAINLVEELRNKDGN